jgi:uncharacterized protein (DUF427 family)
MRKRESVWDYPRPPGMEHSEERIRVLFGGLVIAETQSSIRILETSHPPVYYIPPQDIRMEFLSKSGPTTFCEWKGTASYITIKTEARTTERAAWFYPHPQSPYEAIANCIAFYPSLMDGCYVDDELVMPQPGGFYGGWITSRIEGPFKGGPGTSRW